MQSFRPLMERYRYFFFDCEGVLWHSGREISGAFAVLKSLETLGKRVFLLTNNSAMSRKGGAEFVRAKFGYHIDPGRFCSSAYLAGRYVRDHGFKRIYAIGEEQLFDELAGEGPDRMVVLGREDHKKLGVDAEFVARTKSQKVDAVVVGKDEKLNYFKLAYATFCLSQGAHFIATHRDVVFKSGGISFPSTGATVAALEAATRTRAVNLGKPETYGIHTICKQFGIDLARECQNMLIVGDNIGVEIRLGKTVGIDSLLVLSGFTSKEQVEAESRKQGERIVPTYVLPRLTHGF